MPTLLSFAVLLAFGVGPLGKSFSGAPPSVRVTIPVGQGNDGVGYDEFVMEGAQALLFVGVTAICRMYGLP